MAPTCLILQRRAHKAGAQVSLHRWLRSGAWAGLSPHVLCGQEGWLCEALRAEGVPVTVSPFVSSRALTARLGGNRAFARRARALIPHPQLIIANDHPEGLLAQALSREVQRPWAVVLRSYGASARDLRKYACHQAALRLVVRGPKTPQREPQLLHEAPTFSEGLLPSEFSPAQPPPSGLGPKILVAGSPHPDKGWPDLCAALDAVGTELPRCTWAFTGQAPPSVPGQHFVSLGRVQDYAATVRAHDLVIHPSRGETFGLAVAEAWAAGVPVLASQTGLVPTLPLPEHLSFAPGQVQALADRLKALAAAPPIRESQIEAVQAYLRSAWSWPQGLEVVMQQLRALATD